MFAQEMVIVVVSLPVEEEVAVAQEVVGACAEDTLRAELLVACTMSGEVHAAPLSIDVSFHPHTALFSKCERVHAFLSCNSPAFVRVVQFAPWFLRASMLPVSSCVLFRASFDAQTENGKATFQ